MRHVLMNLEACIEALKKGKPLQARELLQTLLHYQSMSPYEEKLIESCLLAQKYRFDEAIAVVEAVMDVIVSNEIEIA